MQDNLKWVKRALVSTVSGLVALASAPALAKSVELEVWHLMNAAHSQEFVRLVEQFNKDNKDIEVKLVKKRDMSELIQSGVAALKAKRSPHLVELTDVRSPEYVAGQVSVLPMHQLFASYPVRDLQWFLPQSSGALRDAQGRLLAFPLMTEAPVLFYNRDLYARAGLNPNQPPKTWRELQEHLIALSQSGVSCSYGTSWQSWIHVENTAALHNKPFASNDNGLKGASTAQLQINNLLYVRHFALMMSWVRSNLFPVRTHRDEADARFASGECAVLTSGTGAMAAIQAQSKFSVGIASLPYYDEEAARASNPFIGGSSLWASGGKPAAENKATATFLAYLASPVVAAEWHQKTGFLPLTQAAWRASNVSYYKNIPGAEQVVQAMSTKPGANNRGYRLRNYAQVTEIIDAELDAIWQGAKPPKQGLDDAVARANVVIRGK